jgi:hypothetical protein
MAMMMITAIMIPTAHMIPTRRMIDVVWSIQNNSNPIGETNGRGDLDKLFNKVGYRRVGNVSLFDREIDLGLLSD